MSGIKAASNWLVDAMLSCARPGLETKSHGGAPLPQELRRQGSSRSGCRDRDVVRSEHMQRRNSARKVHRVMVATDQELLEAFYKAQQDCVAQEDLQKKEGADAADEP